MCDAHLLSFISTRGAYNLLRISGLTSNIWIDFVVRFKFVGPI